MEAGWRGENKRAAKELFGRPLRVALAAWIMSRGGRSFYLGEAQQAMGLLGEAGSGVAKELAVFEEHGMLIRFEDGRRVYFTPSDSRYWPAFDGIALACGLLASGDADQRASTARAT